ncbi:MAG: hypothetical protein K2O39_02760, partial [Clostridiales bacterium]|nr:hypothetical protein [Clostridiales bacterium]
ALLSVSDYNYCESGAVIDYVDLRFEQAFEHSSDITEVTVTLSNRNANPITFECRYVTYDGKPHGFEFSESVEYLSEQTTFVDVGRHTVSVVVVSDKYLPRVVDCTMVILPDLAGVYVSDAHAIQISGAAVEFDGIDGGELSVVDDNWAWNNKPITSIDNGIVYDGVTYTATTDKILVVRLDNETYAVVSLPQNADQLKVSYNGTTLSFALENEALLNIPLICDRVTMSLKGAPLPALVPNETETFVLGRADLKSNVVIIDIKTNE